MKHPIQVVVATPQHSGLAGSLSYESEQPLSPGTLVRVPLGSRQVLGVVWDGADGEPVQAAYTVKSIHAVVADIAPLNGPWRQLVQFTARYYQRSLGEVALAALPPQLRDLDAVQIARRLKRGGASTQAADWGTPPGYALHPQQEQALALFNAQPGPHLLFGVTGSGKTEVYLQAVQQLLARQPQAQALVMVPEINLTPQLLARFEQRFGAQALVSLHSGMTQPQRLKSWLAAHSGSARIVLGTRMAVFASLPQLRLIVVDEEHDPSYKQQEGARYSARDLAIYRARLEGAKVLLGSATPSLETWHACERGRYTRLDMAWRAGTPASALPTPVPAPVSTPDSTPDSSQPPADAALGQQAPNRAAPPLAPTFPRLRLVDMTQQPRRAVAAPPLVHALSERIARGEQSLILLNRRGYAPVLACAACDWKSECPQCSAYRVFHKSDRSLRCHHCGLAQAVPRACPDCGNMDISTLGRGTEQIEEQLGQLLQAARRPDGAPPRILRMDADTTRPKGALGQQLAQVHNGAVDVLVGTQMIAKGHDFRNITLVAALDADAALFSSDFRAPERLFALLLQAAGRGGRDPAQSARAEMWLQTRYPRHPLFAALRTQDFARFARDQLRERELAALPPFSHQALLRAEARSQDQAQAFLRAAADAAQTLADYAPVSLYEPVPLAVQRVAGVERAQLLVESSSRAALQRFLPPWQRQLHGLRDKSVLRWAIDVDPLAI